MFMNRLYTLLSLVILILTAHNIKAQDRKFRFGLKGAGNLSWNSPDNKQMEGEGALIGYSYGLMGDYQLGDGNYYLNFGLEVLSLNNKLEYTSDVVTETISTTSGDSSSFVAGSSIYENKFGYVSLPLSLKMTTNEIGYITYFVNFGLDLGIRYGAEADIDYNWGKSAQAPQELEVDISSQTSPFRAGLLVGGGLEFNVSGNTNLMAGITFSNGFTNLFSKNYKNDAGEKFENRTVTFDQNGDLKLDDTNQPIYDGNYKKSTLRFVALNVGVYF